LEACQFTNKDGTFTTSSSPVTANGFMTPSRAPAHSLPHCAQWTNNLDAMNKRPYAWLIQGDSENYDLCSVGNCYPRPAITSCQSGDASGTKCAEIKELWPSQNFAGPAAG